MVEAEYTELHKKRSPRKKFIIGGLVAVILVIVIIIIVVVALKEKETSPKEEQRQKYKHGAVASDSSICSQVGVQILRKGGSAVDSAVATVFCAGVVNPNSCGIGGGSFLVVYERELKKVTAYNFREIAPNAANETMYVNKTGASRYGALAIGVPGEVKGLFAVYKKHGSGNVSWADLVEPSIRLAEGVPISQAVANAIKYVKGGVEKGRFNISEGLRELITDKNGKFLTENEEMKNPELARTLRHIQKLNDTDFYNGELAKNITKDIREAGGIITLDDLKNYNVSVGDSFKVDLTGGDTLHTMPLPGGGPVAAMIMNIMSGYNFKDNIDLSNGDEAFPFYQRLVEAMKFAYAQRGFMGDPEFLSKKNITKLMDMIKSKSVAEEIRKKIFLNATFNASYYGGYWAKDDFGTSHTSVVAENGDTVSITSTINMPFGSLFRSPSTGIIFNNEMDDFSTPGMINAYGYLPSPANYIKPGKRPLSSMSPSIVIDKNGELKIATGAAGGSRIISGTTTVMLKYLYLNMELEDAIDTYRLHDQGFPDIVKTDLTIPPVLFNKLKDVGHTVQEKKAKSIVQAVAKKDGYIYAKSDPRKQAVAAGY